MYRNSLKYAQALRANISAKTIVNVPKASIVSQEVTLTNDIVQERKKSFYNFIGKRQATSAFVYLNRDHKFNTLSEGVLEDAQRFLESYETDDIVSAVWLQNQGPTFSKGMDLKAILHNVNTNQHNKAYDYLRKTYDFAMFLGSYNKPLVVLLDGEISNASASMFVSRPHLISTPRTKWQLNETNLGYITDCGASFYLSRMPYEVGTYLALTGRVLNGKELEDLDLVYTYTEKNIRELKDDFVTENSYRDRPTDSKKIYGDKFLEAKLKRKREGFATTEFLQVEFEYRTRERGENPELVLAELQFRQGLQRNANETLGAFNPTNRLYFEGQPLINHTLQFEEMILEGIGLQSDTTRPKLPLEAINRCFRGNSVEEIFNALEEEGSDWARETLEALKTKSPMSLKLTLKLIREGFRSDWSECFQREYRVACRRINDEEFKKSLEARLVNKEKQFTNWTYKRFEDISADKVNSYFAPLDVDIKIEEYQPILPRHCLAPVKHFYHHYPDQVRYWLNKQTIKDVQMRQSQMFSVKHFLYSYGIDFNNPLGGLDLIREKIYQHHEASRIQDIKLNRIIEIAKSKEDIQQYYDIRRQRIDDFFSDSKKADSIIQDKILEAFEEKYEENVKKKSEFAANARKYEKKKALDDIKATIMEGRLIRPLRVTEEDEHRSTVHAKNANIPLFFPENNYESFLDIPNPNLSNHPYLEYINKIKKTRKLDNEYLEAYLKGLISDDEITKFFVDGELPKGEINSKLDMRGPLQPQLIKEKDWELQEEVRQYELVHGEDPLEIERKQNKAQELLELIGKRQQDIADLVQNDKGIRKYVIESVMNETVGQNLPKVGITLENLVTLPNKENAERFQKITVENAKLVVDKSFDTIAETKNFIDLEPKAVKKEEAKVLYADPSNTNNQSIEAYEAQLLSMLKLDDILKQTLEPILNANGHAQQGFSQLFKNLLLSIYKRKVDTVLGQEQQKYKNVMPLFTRDGKNVLTKQDMSQTETMFMETIDDYIVNNTLFEFNRYVSSHVFFLFSYLGLLELEKIYHALGSVILGKGRRTDFDFSAVVNLLRERNIKISKKEELNALLNHLNEISASLCQLFYTYKDQLHFTEDIILEKYMKLKYASNRYNLGLRNKRNFVNTVLENFREHYAVQQEVKNLNLETNDGLPVPDENAYKLALLRPDEIKSYDEDIVERAMNATEAYFRGNNKAKGFIPGSLRYLFDLEQANKQAIYGRYAAFPVDGFSQKDLEIPEYFDKFDLREPLDVWFEKKLKETIHQYLQERSRFQDILNQEELIALDKDLARLLTPENIKESMMTSLENDIAVLNHFNEEYIISNSNEGNILSQANKAPIMQANFNKSIKNPEALNKFMAFGITMYEKYKNKKTKQVNTLLLSVRSQMLDRLYKEAFEEPKPLSSMEEFTKGEKVDEVEAAKLRKIEELRTLKEFDINQETSVVLKSLLEDLSENENRKPELRKELEYLFKRHEISS